MLENLFNLVKEHAGSAIVSNPAIPNEQNDEAVASATSSITDGIKNAIAGGNLQGVLSMFSGQSDAGSSPVSQEIQGNFVQDLVSKFGMNQSDATSTASGLIPNVLNKLVHKTNDPGDSSFDLQGIMNSLSGGSTSGFNIQGLMDKFKGGLDKNGDGHVDMQDLTSLFQGGGSEGGGIMDKLKGLFS
ncbi:MAG: hypothetical protein J0I41_16760 [Filimonas sp.]|nr:hypothetical protein [Filimonas sp.]